jgi:broad specificity phosphatase PhoE
MYVRGNNTMATDNTTITQEEREQRLRKQFPIELFLIRHGEPDWTSQTDPGLTEHGHRTARVLAEHLGDTKFTALICSPLRRARETAAPIAAVQQMQPVIVDGLAEISVPLFGTLSQTEVDAYFRSAAHRPFKEHWEGFPGGEPFREFHRRVTSALTDVLNPYDVHSHETEGFDVWSSPTRTNTVRLAIVAHGGTNAVALTHLLGIAPVPWEWIRFETPLAAYSVVGLRAINSRAHIWSLQQFGRRVGQ